MHEVTQGKAIADAVVSANATYLIWSTVTSPKKLSKGKYTNVTLFETKAIVKEYIQTLPITSFFFEPGSFMQNCNGPWLPRPTSDTSEERTLAIYNVMPPTAKIPLIDVVADTGRFVGAFLCESEMLKGKNLYAASGFWTMDEIAEAMG